MFKEASENTLTECNINFNRLLIRDENGENDLYLLFNNGEMKIQVLFPYKKEYYEKFVIEIKKIIDRMNIHNAEFTMVYDDELRKALKENGFVAKRPDKKENEQQEFTNNRELFEKPNFEKNIKK